MNVKMLLLSALLGGALGLVIAFVRGKGAHPWLGTLLWMIGFAAGQQALQKWTDSRAAKAGVNETASQRGVFELGKSASLYHLSATADGRRVATRIASGTLTVWDTATGKPLWKLDSMGTGSTRFSPSGNLVAVSGSAHGRRAIQLHTSSDGRHVATLEGEPARKWTPDDLVFSEDGAYLLISGEHTEVAFYDLGDLDTQSTRTEQPKKLDPVIVPRPFKLQNFFPHREPLVGFGSNNRSVFVLSRDRHTIEHWSLEDEPRLLYTTAFRDSHRVTPQGLSRDGTLAFECGTRSLQLVETGATLPSEVINMSVPVEMPPGAYHVSTFCALSPDKRSIAMGIAETGGSAKFIYTVNVWKSDGTILLGDTESTEGKTAESTPQLAAMAYSPDSRFLYTADDHMRLHFYTLDRSPKGAVIPGDQFGFTRKSSPLIAASNTGAAFSHHGASKVVWIATPEPPR